MNNRRFNSVLLRIVAAFLLAAAAPLTRADVILDWNAEALTAIRTYDDSSPYAARNLAMLQTAVYNAVEGIAGQHNLYTSGSYSGPSGTAPDGASMEAAAAAAAYTILSSLYSGSSGTYASLLSSQLSGIADGQAKIDGINYGTLVANDILNWRSTDGAAGADAPGLYSPVGSAGYWQETPPAYAAAGLPGWGGVTPFAIASSAGFISTLPGALANGDYIQTAGYAADYNSVKELGSMSSGTRTADQLNSAYFWDAPTGTITIAGMWNEVAQGVATNAGLTLLDTARLLASLNVAMADAGILSWEMKYDVDFWSPVTAIANGDADSNGATAADPFWTPLLNSTNYPGYGSEHSAFSAAATQILAGFVGDLHTFSLGSDLDGDGTDDLLRNFNSFSEAQNEAGLSRIYGGVQFGADNQAGLELGELTGNYVLNNYFNPVPEPAGALLVLIGAGALTARRRRSSW